MPGTFRVVASLLQRSYRRQRLIQHCFGKIQMRHQADGLRTEGGSVPLIYESLENGIDTALRFFLEYAEARRSRVA